jgi:membrane associated rhomboid family serine protease
MIIPIRTDYRRRHTPWVNYALVLANVLLYFLGYNGASQQGMLKIEEWMLHAGDPRLEQFVSCTFLHAGLAHLLGNMVFLWVFGNAINDKLGQAGYLAFYLAGGILASIGYILLGGTGQLLGASGAIAAVTGAYLVLLPATNITLIVWLFYFIWPWEVSSLLFIAFQFVFDLFMTLQGAAGIATGSVAYAAHASGYAFGMIVAVGLLATRLLPRDDFDLLHMVRNRHRRAKFRRVVNQGYDPFRGRAPGGRRVVSHTVTAAEPDTPESLLRQQITQLLAEHDTPAAARGYLKLEELTDEPVLPQPQQLDVANQLMAEQLYPAAARAYERFVEHYGDYQHLGDIHLMLGLIYGRYVQDLDRAAIMLRTAVSQLADESKRQLAERELQSVLERMPPA